MKRLNFIKGTITAFSFFLLTSCSQDDRVPSGVVNLTLAAEMSLLPATVWVAEKKGYFKDNDINLTIQEFDSGRNALESMLNNKSIDISTVAQTPIVFNSFNDEPYVIFATMAYSLDDIKVLARKDHGITQASHIKGKKVGATKRSTGHYFLEGFLSHYGFDLGAVNLIDINASELANQLASGEVSAITSWEPHISRAEKAIGKDNLTLMISPTPFRKDFFFTTSREFADTKSYQLERFLAALVEAENFIAANPEESKAIISKRLSADPELINKIWDTFTFEITLEQSILLNLDDEGVWATKFSEKKVELPDYTKYIDTRALTKVKPEGVNIVL